MPTKPAVVLLKPPAWPCVSTVLIVVPQPPPQLAGKPAIAQFAGGAGGAGGGAAEALQLCEATLSEPAVQV
ncbi:MAG: hypothetical protein C0423_01810 [Methylibium sp.]|nr:hypothetical protein [Methylibium sp.]